LGLFISFFFAVAGHADPQVISEHLAKNIPELPFSISGFAGLLESHFNHDVWSHVWRYMVRTKKDWRGARFIANRYRACKQANPESGYDLGQVAIYVSRLVDADTPFENWFNPIGVPATWEAGYLDNYDAVRVFLASISKLSFETKFRWKGFFVPQWHETKNFEKDFLKWEREKNLSIQDSLPSLATDTRGSLYEEITLGHFILGGALGITAKLAIGAALGFGIMSGGLFGIAAPAIAGMCVVAGVSNYASRFADQVAPKIFDLASKFLSISPRENLSAMLTTGLGGAIIGSPEKTSGVFMHALIPPLTPAQQSFLEESLATYEDASFESGLSAFHDEEYRKILNALADREMSFESAQMALIKIIRSDWVEKCEEAGLKPEKIRLDDFLNRLRARQMPVPAWMERFVAESECNAALEVVVLTAPVGLKYGEEQYPTDDYLGLRFTAAPEQHLLTTPLGLGRGSLIEIEPNASSFDGFKTSFLPEELLMAAQRFEEGAYKPSLRSLAKEIQLEQLGTFCQEEDWVLHLSRRKNIRFHRGVWHPYVSIRHDLHTHWNYLCLFSKAFRDDATSVYQALHAIDPVLRRKFLSDDDLSRVLECVQIVRREDNGKWKTHFDYFVYEVAMVKAEDPKEFFEQFWTNLQKQLENYPDKLRRLRKDFSNELSSNVQSENRPAEFQKKKVDKPHAVVVNSITPDSPPSLLADTRGSLYEEITLGHFILGGALGITAKLAIGAALGFGIMSGGLFGIAAPVIGGMCVVAGLSNYDFRFITQAASKLLETASNTFTLASNSTAKNVSDSLAHYSSLALRSWDAALLFASRLVDIAPLYTAFVQKLSIVSETISAQMQGGTAIAHLLPGSIPLSRLLPLITLSAILYGSQAVFRLMQRGGNDNSIDASKLANIDPRDPPANDHSIDHLHERVYEFENEISDRSAETIRNLLEDLSSLVEFALESANAELLIECIVLSGRVRIASGFSEKEWREQHSFIPEYHFILDGRHTTDPDIIHLYNLSQQALKGKDVPRSYARVAFRLHLNEKLLEAFLVLIEKSQSKPRVQAEAIALMGRNPSLSLAGRQQLIASLFNFPERELSLATKQRLEDQITYFPYLYTQASIYFFLYQQQMLPEGEGVIEAVSEAIGFRAGTADALPSLSLELLREKFSPTLKDSHQNSYQVRAAEGEGRAYRVVAVEVRDGDYYTIYLSRPLLKAGKIVLDDQGHVLEEALELTGRDPLLAALKPNFLVDLKWEDPTSWGKDIPPVLSGYHLFTSLLALAGISFASQAEGQVSNGAQQSDYSITGILHSASSSYDAISHALHGFLTHSIASVFESAHSLATATSHLAHSPLGSAIGVISCLTVFVNFGLPSDLRHTLLPEPLSDEDDAIVGAAFVKYETDFKDASGILQKIEYAHTKARTDENPHGAYGVRNLIAAVIVPALLKEEFREVGDHAHVVAQHHLRRFYACPLELVEIPVLRVYAAALARHMKERGIEASLEMLGSLENTIVPVDAYPATDPYSAYLKRSRELIEEDLSGEVKNVVMDLPIPACRVEDRSFIDELYDYYHRCYAEYFLPETKRVLIDLKIKFLIDKYTPREKSDAAKNWVVDILLSVLITQKSKIILESGDANQLWLYVSMHLLRRLKAIPWSWVKPSVLEAYADALVFAVHRKGLKYTQDLIGEIELKPIRLDGDAPIEEYIERCTKYVRGKLFLDGAKAFIPVGISFDFNSHTPGFVRQMSSGIKTLLNTAYPFAEQTIHFLHDAVLRVYDAVQNFIHQQDLVAAQMQGLPFFGMSLPGAMGGTGIIAVLGMACVWGMLPHAREKRDPVTYETSPASSFLSQISSLHVSPYSITSFSTLRKCFRALTPLVVGLSLALGLSLVPNEAEASTSTPTPMEEVPPVPAAPVLEIQETLISDEERRKEPWKVPTKVLGLDWDGKEKFGSFIKRWRLVKKLTQSQLAELLKREADYVMESSSLSKYEGGLVQEIPLGFLNACARVEGNSDVRDLAYLSACEHYEKPGVAALAISDEYFCYLGDPFIAWRFVALASAEVTPVSFRFLLLVALSRLDRVHSLEGLAEVCGVSVAIIKYYLRGSSQPSSKNIEGLASALRIDARAIITGMNLDRGLVPALEVLGLPPHTWINGAAGSNDAKNLHDFADKKTRGILDASAAEYFPYRAWLGMKRHALYATAMGLASQLDEYSTFFTRRFSGIVNKPNASNLADWVHIFRMLEMDPEEVMTPFLPSFEIELQSFYWFFCLGSAGLTLLEISKKTKIASKYLGEFYRSKLGTIPLSLHHAARLALALPRLPVVKVLRVLDCGDFIFKCFPELDTKEAVLVLDAAELKRVFDFKISESLNTQMRQQNKKVDEMVSVLGVSKSTVQRYLNPKDEFVPSDKTLRALASFMGVPVKVLYLHYHPELFLLFPLRTEGGKRYSLPAKARKQIQVEVCGRGMPVELCLASSFLGSAEDKFLEEMEKFYPDATNAKRRMLEREEELTLLRIYRTSGDASQKKRAESVLVKAYWHFIDKYARQAGEDCWADAYIHFKHQLDRFDFSTGFRLFTYAEVGMIRWVLNWRKTAGRKKRSYDGVVSFDKEVYEEGATIIGDRFSYGEQTRMSYDPEDPNFRKALLKMNQWIDAQSDAEICRRIFIDCILRGEDQGRVASDLNLKTHRVKYIKAKTLEVAKEIFGDFA